jgi:hypothetical protein
VHACTKDRDPACSPQAPVLHPAQGSQSSSHTKDRLTREKAHKLIFIQFLYDTGIFRNEKPKKQEIVYFYGVVQK